MRRSGEWRTSKIYCDSAVHKWRLAHARPKNTLCLMLRAIVSLEIMLKRKFHFVFYFCLFFLSGPECVSAFPNGAPVQACDTLSPSPVGHLVAASNCPEPCPFRMEVMEIIGVPNSADSTEYFCGSLHRSK